MKNFFLIKLLLIFILILGCETVKKKSDEVAEREHEKYGQFLGKKVTDLKMEMGASTDDYLNENGNKILLYKTKKYGISCERKFEVNNNNIIIKFSSSGCI
tara:strand:- start:387 stop:689 length:303 start_codon:yes stop_codon:yes gene_type:complete